MYCQDKGSTASKSKEGKSEGECFFFSFLFGALPFLSRFFQCPCSGLSFLHRLLLCAHVNQAKKRERERVYTSMNERERGKGSSVPGSWKWKKDRMTTIGSATRMHRDKRGQREGEGER